MESAGLQQAKFTLYIGDMNLSSWSMRAWMALKQCGFPFDTVKIKLDTPNTRNEILKFNAAGKVPALKIGNTVVWDSLSICEYIAELFPTAKLWPKEMKARSHARSISAEMHSGFAALRKQLPMHCHDADRNKLAAIDNACRNDIQRVFELWEECKDLYGQSGDFLFNHFTIADAMYAPVIIRFKTYGVEIPEAVRPYVEAMWELPAMREWIAGAKTEIQ